MDSFLVTGGTQISRKEKALTFSKIYSVSHFDTLVIQPESASESLGIDQIRNLKTKLLLRPFNSKVKLAIFLDFERATAEAQNAFLKSLEEPPNNTIIVLTSANADLLLPTIVSRCQLISLATSNWQLATSELSTLNSQLSTLLEGGVGERLKLAQDISKNREEAAGWLEKMTIIARQLLMDSIINGSKKEKNHSQKSQTNFSAIIQAFQKTRTQLLATNVNSRFALEICFLNL